jgi:hypothetical protein
MSKSCEYTPWFRWLVNIFQVLISHSIKYSPLFPITHESRFIYSRNTAWTSVKVSSSQRSVMAWWRDWTPHTLRSLSFSFKKTKRQKLHGLRSGEYGGRSAHPSLRRSNSAGPILPLWQRELFMSIGKATPGWWRQNLSFPLVNAATISEIKWFWMND